MDKNEILWLAGIMEGEGCFGITSNNRLVLNCTSTDKDVVQRILRGMGCGNINKNKLLENRKQSFSWRTGNRRNVIEIITELLPHMGTRRSEKIQEMLEYNEKNPPIRQEKGKVKHGTRAMYSRYSCRCTECCAAESAYKRPRYLISKNIIK